MKPRHTSFQTFEIPDPLPQGDDKFFIAHNDIGYSLTAGVPFDFTTIDPLGVDSFLLLGIDETELIDSDANSDPPFVFGMTFAEPGIANFSTFPLLAAVPEPSTLLLAVLALLGLLSHGRRRRRA